MHNPNACPICKTTSKSLAGIVASETSNGEWSGSAGGIGIGAGGPLLIVGGASGTRREQTQRAQAFAAPAPEARAKAPAMLVSAVLILLAGGLIYGIGLPLAGSMFSGPVQPGPMGQVEMQLSDLMPVAGVFLLLAIFGVVGMKVYGAHEAATDPAEQKRFRAAQARDRARAEAYSRLRYCEADHIVFDPKTGSHAPADAASVSGLLNTISGN